MTVHTTAPPEPGTARLAPPQRILVATDGSDLAATAVRAATALAGEAGARLEVVSVAPVPVYPTGMGNYPVGVPEDRALYKETLRVAEEAQDLAEKAGVACTARVERGTAPWSILSRAATTGADLIVIGATGHGLVRGILLGSVSQRVVKAATVPVLVIRGALTWPPRVCLVGFDGSANACHAAATAASVVRPGGARLELVLADDGSRGSLELHLLRVSSMRRHVERLCELGLRSVDGVDIAEPPVTALTRGVDPASTLVAVGRRGRSRVAGVMFGSVSWDVLTKAPVSVLVVPPATMGGCELRLR